MIDRLTARAIKETVRQAIVINRFGSLDAYEAWLRGQMNEVFPVIRSCDFDPEMHRRMSEDITATIDWEVRA